METARRSLAGGTARDVVPIPWQGWSLRRDAFLVTRMTEIVVYADDLALSVGIDNHWVRSLRVNVLITADWP